MYAVTGGLRAQRRAASVCNSRRGAKVAVGLFSGVHGNLEAESECHVSGHEHKHAPYAKTILTPRPNEIEEGERRKEEVGPRERSSGHWSVPWKRTVPWKGTVRTQPLLFPPFSLRNHE
ncbi:hypothetical protein STEG23_017301, partial [Scotinomys teguina]